MRFACECWNRGTGSCAVAALVAEHRNGRGEGMSVGMMEPEQLARRAGLIYIAETETGLSRRRRGRGFYFLDVSGRRVRSRQLLTRLRSLAIPPAWKEVWICASPRGHIQATGRDDRGRKQYIYHERWRRAANLTKFAGLAQFGGTLPRIRRAVREQLAASGLGCDKVLALLVAILDTTGMRVGNEEYAEANDHYGLTTLRKHHLRANGKGVEFRYPGKSGQKQVIAITDDSLVSLIQQCAGLPGRLLFQYPSDQCPFPVTSYDVNDYLRRIAGSEEISAKDFRTWKGTVLAAELLYEQRRVEKPRERRRVAVQVVRAVAERLGNTPSVCRAYYIHPMLLESFVDGRFQQLTGDYRPRRHAVFSAGEQLVRHCLKTYRISQNLAALAG